MSVFEAQTTHEIMTETEIEDFEVRKRREEGTPCNKENFELWVVAFVAERAQQREVELDEDGAKRKADPKKVEDKTGRLTGFQHFSGAAGDIEALEAAAEQAENDQMDEVDEELFDDDVDLDGLDFDDDFNEEEDDDVLDI
jgi:hypothetical protein